MTTIYMLLGIQLVVQAHNYQGGGGGGGGGSGGLLCPVLKIRKKLPHFVKNALIVFIFEFAQIFHSKCSFKSIQEKKLPNFSMRGLFSWCF